MTLNYRIQVFGKVQGVFYRASTKGVAEQLGIVGFIENLSDGSVYIEAQGDEIALKKLVDWCNRGPSGAEVSHVEVEEGPLQDYRSFEVERRF